MPIVLLVCHVVATVAALPGQKMIQNEEDKSLQQRSEVVVFRKFVERPSLLDPLDPSLQKSSCWIFAIIFGVELFSGTSPLFDFKVHMMTS